MLCSMWSRGNTSISKVLANLYGHLSHSLIRANAHAILTGSYCHLMQQADGLYVKHCTCLVEHSKFLIFPYF